MNSAPPAGPTIEFQRRKWPRFTRGPRTRKNFKSTFVILRLETTGPLSGFAAMNLIRLVILRLSENPEALSHAGILLDSSLPFGMTNREVHQQRSEEFSRSFEFGKATESELARAGGAVNRPPAVQRIAAR